MTLSREDRITGCLLGGALGDAIGSRFETAGANVDFEIPRDLRVSDDTQLTIATCESIVQSRAITPEAMASHFLRWYRDRRIVGIGSSTLKSFTELDAGGHWALVGATGERSAGNGAAMRIAPLAFFLDPNIDTQRQTIRDICRITHRNDEAYIGALALLQSIRRVVQGAQLDSGILSLLVDSLPDSRVRDRLSAVCDASLTIEQYAEQFGTSGYVVDSVPLAILAVTQATDILAMIKRLVQCGGDTDTIASIFGQLFGAAHGTHSLPMETVNQIDAARLVQDTAASLAHTAVAI